MSYDRIERILIQPSTVATGPNDAGRMWKVVEFGQIPFVRRIDWLGYSFSVGGAAVPDPRTILVRLDWGGRGTALHQIHRTGAINLTTAQNTANDLLIIPESGTQIPPVAGAEVYIVGERFFSYPIPLIRFDREQIVSPLKSVRVTLTNPNFPLTHEPVANNSWVEVGILLGFVVGEHPK